MIFYSNDSPLKSNRLNNLGPEPLEEEFNYKYLYSISRNRNIAIKSLLMNAKVVVGIGNIYASEALFLSKIRTSKNFQKVIKKIVKILYLL